MIKCSTPGPWTLDRYDIRKIVAIDRIFIAEVTGALSDPGVVADAHLIAEAPELLALAREVEQLITLDSDDLGFHLKVVPMRVETARALRAAIARAEGGAR